MKSRARETWKIQNGIRCYEKNQVINLSFDVLSSYLIFFFQRARGVCTLASEARDRVGAAIAPGGVVGTRAGLLIKSDERTSHQSCHTNRVEIRI